jgi:hypothetical protein
MTGPLGGLGPNGAIKQANDSIRDFCETNNKILYDFADIEKYDPDGITNYQEYGANDACAYDPDGEYPYDQTENWAENWISQNPDDTLSLLTSNANSDDCDYGHTHCLNCVLKGIAAWQLWARIAGWEGPPQPLTKTSSFTAESGIWNNLNNWDNGIPGNFTKAIIQENNSVTIDNNAQCSTLIAKPESEIKIMEGDTLSAYHITLEAGLNDSSTAKLLNYGWINSTNGISIEKYIKRNSWKGISSPINNGTSSIFNATEEELYYWNPDTQKHIKISDEATDIEVMKGYQYRNKSNDTTITFNGEPNQGKQEYKLNYKSYDTLYNNWNFIGNPFPASVYWDNQGWNKENVANSIYFYPEDSGQVWSYVNGISNPAGSTDGTIPPMKAFWVYSVNNGSISATNIIQKPKTTKHSLQSQEKENTKGIRLKISGNNENYETVIRFNDSATSGFDPNYDAFHFNIPQIDKSYAPGLFTLDSNSNPLAINSLPENEVINIPLEYTVLNSGSYTIETTEILNINDTLYLKDLKNKKHIPITDTSYSFNTTRGTHAGQFVITDTAFSDTSFTKINPGKKQQLSVFSHDHKIIIHSEKYTNAKVKVINLAGKLLYQKEMNFSGRHSIYMEREGFFIVIIQTPEQTHSYKIIIR